MEINNNLKKITTDKAVNQGNNSFANFLEKKNKEYEIKMNKKKAFKKQRDNYYNYCSRNSYLSLDEYCKLHNVELLTDEDEIKFAFKPFEPFENKPE